MNKNITKIKLTQGFTALIDKEDFQRVSQHLWQIFKSDHTNYARSTMIIYGKTRKTISLHRFILNAKKGKEINHINKNGLDNRRCNLRICTRTENCWNSHKIYSRRRNPPTSRYKGVSFDKENNKYRVRIKLNGKNIYLGRFRNEKAAALVYNEKAIKLFGEFARLNIVKL